MVDNEGGAAGDYDLADKLRFGTGVTITDAEVITAPAGVITNAGWTGEGTTGSSENDIATGVALGAGAGHTYQVEVTVALDDATVSSSTLACPGAGTGGDGGLANTATLTHNGVDTASDACASLPLIEVDKSISGGVYQVAGQPGQYDVVYEITVTNSGPAAGEYDLDDELSPGDGITVVEVDPAPSDAPSPQPINTGFDGATDTRIVSGQAIAGATSAPVVHTYAVRVRYAADLAQFSTTGPADCGTGSRAAAGTMANTATVSWNGLADEDDACLRPGKPTLDKALVSAEPIGGGQWQVDYDLTVGNVGAEPTAYDLDDELLFAPSVTVDSVTVTGPAGVTVNGGFDGDTDTRIATHAVVAGLDDTGYAPHVYRVSVVADVPLHVDPPAADGTGSTACTQPAGSNTLAQALNNAATLTDESGGRRTDTDCAPLPSFAVSKVIDEGPSQVADGSWRISYRVEVVNDGAAAGAYDVTDRLRFGDGIDVDSAAVVETPTGVAPSPGWTGQGSDGSTMNLLAEDVDLDPGVTHTYRIRVDATVDNRSTDASTYTCAPAGSGDAGGFGNVAGLDHNELADAADACAVPSRWTPPGSTSAELPQTGAPFGGTTLVFGWLLLAGGLLLVVLGRRRRVG